MRLPSIRSNGNKLGVLALAALMVPLAGLNVGCTGDNDPKGFIDPTATGRWKQKPLVVPVLDKLDIGVEEPNEEFTQATDVRPEDLNAQPQDYRISANDVLTISVSDLIGPGVESMKQGRVTESGKISLPAIGQVQAAGLTEAELEQQIVSAYREAKLIDNAQVTVTVSEPQGKAYSVIGAVIRPGRYPIIQSDFRILDALVQCGDVYTGSDYVYVIRSTKQRGAAATTAPAMQGAPAGGQGVTPDMLAPSTEPAGAAPSPAPDLAPAAPAPAPAPAEPATTTPAANGGNVPGGGAAEDNAATAPTTVRAAGAGVEPEGRIVTLEGQQKAIGSDAAAAPAAAPGETPVVTSETTMNGPNAATVPAGQFEFNTPDGSGDFRQIRIPVSELKNSNFMKYNIAILPGDMIVVPGPVVGNYFMGGHVNRPGVFQLTGQKITLKQAIISAGMFDQLAVPWRTEIIRRLPGNKEVYATVNLSRVFAGTDPEIYLKPNDVLNVGTSMWAPFVASIRNAFRFTYGFGFIYDKNFNERAETGRG